MAVRTSVRATIGGSTEGGALASKAYDFYLDDQDQHNQLSVTIEPGDVLKPVTLPVQPAESGAKQTFFMLRTDGDIQVRLNDNTDLTFSMHANGIMTFSGLPEIRKMEFSALPGQVGEVKAFINKIIGATTLPDPGSGGAIGRVVDKFTATAGQTVFTLTREPEEADVWPLFIEGVEYDSPTFFTVSGTTLTWLDVPFTLPAGARVTFYYE